MTAMSREDFDAEMTEHYRQANERWAAVNLDMDRHDQRLAKIEDRMARIEAIQERSQEILERQGLSVELLLSERKK